MLLESPTFWIDRQNECACLRRAVDMRESMLVSGPAGIGKTALLARVLSGLEPTVASHCFYLSGTATPRDLLCGLLTRLRRLQDPKLLGQLRRERIRESEFVVWLRAQSSSRLKGALYRSAETGRYWLFIDHAPRPTAAGAKILKELVHMRRTPVYWSARGTGEGDLGHLGDLWWNPASRLQLGPLAMEDARQLIERRMKVNSLEGINLTDFGKEALRLSGQVPGLIVRMCELASDPRYRYGKQIKTRLIHLDAMISGADFGTRYGRGKIA